MKKKQLTAIAMAGVLAAGVLSYGVSAQADGFSTDYTITIPATLTVADAGWNATDGITANNSTNNFDTGKKLTVTAASTNNWALKSGDNSVGYNLAASGDENSAYNSGATASSWEFSAGELNAESGTNKGMGIIVENYNEKPAGNYTDTVTFTAKVENAVTTRTVTWNMSDITGTYGESFTKDGITITADMIDFNDKNFMNSSSTGTFTTASGKFTKIEVTAANNVSGTGWSGSNSKKTWTGDASSSVSFGGAIMGMGQSLTIVFTIEE